MRETRHRLPYFLHGRLFKRELHPIPGAEQHQQEVDDADIRGKSPDQRRQARHTRARPLLDDLERWLPGAGIYAREGVDLDRALLASWVGAASALLLPLVNAVRHHVLAASKLYADDTPIPVLAPGNGKTKTARLWTYLHDDRPAGDSTPPAVWFAYTPDRKGVHPQTHLAKFEGVLQADVYAGFNALFDDGTIREAAAGRTRDANSTTCTQRAQRR